MASWFEEIKKGKLAVAHRSTILSLLPSGSGEVQQELVVQGLPVGESNKIQSPTPTLPVREGEILIQFFYPL